MSRIQLALNVSDLDAAVAFYGDLFGAEPHKRRPGYANFALEEPPLKLVLIEDESRGGTLNHLGVEVATRAEVRATTSGLAAAGLDVDAREAEICCYAEQDKVWVEGPDGEPWEVYTVTDDDPAVPAVAEPCCGEVTAVAASG